MDVRRPDIHVVSPAVNASTASMSGTKRRRSTFLVTKDHARCGISIAFRSRTLRTRRGEMGVSRQELYKIPAMMDGSATMDGPSRFLVIDDHETFVTGVGGTLQTLGYVVWG